MKNIYLVLLLVALPGTEALAEEQHQSAVAAPSSQPAAVEESDSADDTSDLGKDVVQKLSAQQLTEVIKHRETVRGSMQHAADLGVLIPILVPIAAFAMILGLGLIRQRGERTRYEVIRQLAEKGAAIPPELFVQPRPVRSDLRRGLISVGLGLGGMIALAMYGPAGSWGLGFIPLLIGAGLLLSWKLEGKKVG